MTKTSIDIPKIIRILVKIFIAEIEVTVVAKTDEALVDEVPLTDGVVLCIELIIIDLGISAIYILILILNGATFYIKIVSIHKVNYHSILARYYLSKLKFTLLKSANVI